MSCIRCFFVNKKIIWQGYILRHKFDFLPPPPLFFLMISLPWHLFLGGMPGNFFWGCYVINIFKALFFILLFSSHFPYVSYTKWYKNKNKIILKHLLCINEKNQLVGLGDFLWSEGTESCWQRPRWLQIWTFAFEIFCHLLFWSI